MERRSYQIDALAENLKILRRNNGFSQEHVSKGIGISRSSYSQMETGVRQISAMELIKLADLYMITVDELIYGSKYEVELSEERMETSRQKIRISVPQKNFEKFRATLMYILEEVGGKPNIGETVLYKLLYFCDFNYYEKYEEQLIGATYIKNHFGPTPVEFQKFLSVLIKNGDIQICKNEYHNFPQTRYIALRNADLSPLSANEIKTIDDVLGKLSDKNATEISDYSHEDVPWKYAKDNQSISYEAVFYRTPAYSVRNYSEEEGGE